MPRSKPAAAKGGRASPKAPEQVRSVRELAKRLMKSHTAVAGWVKHPSWTFGVGPWAVTRLPEIELWARRTLSPDPAASVGGAAPRRRALSVEDLDPKQRIDVALKMQKLEQARFEHDRDKGLFHSVEECKQRQVQLMLELKAALLQLPEGLPFGTDVRDVVRGEVIKLLTRISQGR